MDKSSLASALKETLGVGDRWMKDHGVDMDTLTRLVNDTQERITACERAMQPKVYTSKTTAQLLADKRGGITVDTPREIIEKALGAADKSCHLACENGKPCPMNRVRVDDRFCKSASR